MKSEYRGILAIALSAAVFILWYTVFAPPKPKPQQAQVQQAQTAVETQAAETAQKAKEEAKPETAKKADTTNDPQANFPVKTSLIGTDLASIEFTTDDAAPVSWKLKKFQKQDKKETVPVDLAYAGENTGPMTDLKFLGANFSFPDRPRYRLVEAGADSIVYRWESPDVEVIKTIKLSNDSYLADVTVEVINHSERTITERPLLSVTGENLPAKKGGFFSFLKQPPSTNKSAVFYLNGKTERETNTGKTQEKTGTLYWAGLEDRYFITAVIPREVSSQTSTVISSEDIKDVAGGKVLYSGAALAQASIAPGEKALHKFSIYAGPKEINQLKAVGVNLEKSIDYGWFTVVAVPILYLLKFFYGVVRNYGVAIILLTIFIKLLLHPINVKSLKSMKQMQQLQPRLKELQQKYKGDKEKINLETMQLFRSNKVNPMGGCLPMVVQFPIYIALYKVLWSSIELYRAPFFWFYRDLSAPDPYMITPILLGIGMVLQQKLTPSTSADPTQQKMMMFMPIMFSVFMLFLPVGLVIYILVNTVMSVTQQWMYNHDIKFRDLIKGKLPVRA